MPGNITLTLNVPRTELRRKGWTKSKTCGSLKPAIFDERNGRFRVGPWPDDFWKEPNTGTIMFAPATQRPDYREYDVFEELKIPKYKVRVAGDGMLYRDYDGTYYSERVAGGVIIEPLLEVTIQTILVHMKTTMKVVLETKDPLAVNEGFCVFIYPAGIYTDRATDYMLIGFGGRQYVLHIKMNGTASLWSNAGTYADPEWIERTSFNFGQGGVQHNRPFSVTVIPWGTEFISFVFSQGGADVKPSLSALKTSTQSAFLYKISAHEDAPDFDSVLGDTIKTKAGALSIAIRGADYQYAFALSKVRYPTEEKTLTIFQEHIPEPKPHAEPTVEPLKVEPAESEITATYVNQEDEAWDKAVDTAINAKVKFKASTGGLYSPYLTGLTWDVPPLTHTPDWTPIDISTEWTLIRFQRTTELDVSVGEFKIQRQADLPLVYKCGGPIQVKVGGETVWDGYITNKKPTIEGKSALVTDQTEARDMWLRLNKAKIGSYKFLDREAVVTIAKDLIMRVGFTDEEVEIDDPDGYLAQFLFGGFKDPNDTKAFNPDATVGDALREFKKRFGPVPFRVRWTGIKWRIYAAPQYEYDPAAEEPDVSKLPTKIFYTQLSLATQNNEIDRWDNDEYLITSSLEFCRSQPKYNSLVGRGATGTGDGAKASEAVIGDELLTDPPSVTDPDHVDFTGFIDTEYKTFADAQNQAELSQLTRAEWDWNRSERPPLEFAAEWNQTIDVDQFIWIIGVDDEGNTVSLGAFRIEHIDVEMAYDYPSRGGMKWSYGGSYTVVFVGVAESEDAPMFTDILPLAA